MTDILAVDRLTVTFGGLFANKAINLAVPAGALVGLIGPNGAGKTTFLDAITGFVPLASGTVEFDGERIDQVAPHQRARTGLVRTFQSLKLYEDLTVRDNLRVGAYTRPWWAVLGDMIRPSHADDAVEEHIEEALELMGLGDDGDRLPTELSHGRRTLVGVARAVAAQPKLLLLDEPAAGLDTAETDALAQRLSSLVTDDRSILLIDHDMGLVLNVCDYVFVLDFGELIAAGTPEEIRTNPAVLQSYLGSGGA